MKKTPGLTFFVLILATIILLSVTGCTSNNEPAESTTGKTTTPPTTTTEAATDETLAPMEYTQDGIEYKTGENLPWPADFMGDIMELDINIITIAYSPDTQDLSLMYKDGDRDEIDECIDLLKELGYETVLDITGNDGGHSFSGVKEGGTGVMIVHGGDGTGMITYAPSGSVQ